MAYSKGASSRTPRGASCVSRRRMFETVRDVAQDASASLTSTASYADLKVSPALRSREQVKREVKGLALQGWKRNDGDEDWALD